MHVNFHITTPPAALWDQFVRQHPQGHLLQLPAWGELKAGFGWQPLRVALADDQENLCAGVQLLLRRLPFALGTLAYAPYAPLVDWSDRAMVDTLLAGVRGAVGEQRAAFLKIEPGYDVDPAHLRAAGFQPSPQTVQPPRTIVLDLDNTKNILERMNQMTRRNIRKSEKQTVDIRVGTREDVASFNAMLSETGQRQAFGVHVPAYYECAYDLLVANGDGVLLLGSSAGLDLAGVFVFKLGRQAWYLYGASRDQERQKMAAFGVQWAGIQWALAQGCTTYDMVGIPDADEASLEAQFETRHEGLWGVYRFKRGWGGRILRSVGAWDKTYNRPLYFLYQLALRARRFHSDG